MPFHIVPLINTLLIGLLTPELLILLSSPASFMYIIPSQAFYLLVETKMASARQLALAGSLGVLALAPADAFWSWGSGRKLQEEIAIADKAKKSKSPQKIDNQRTVSHWPEFGPGECGVYTRGDAEIAFCVESLNEFHKDIKKVSKEGERRSSCL